MSIFDDELKAQLAAEAEARGYRSNATPAAKAPSFVDDVNELRQMVEKLTMQGRKQDEEIRTLQGELQELKAQVQTETDPRRISAALGDLARGQMRERG